MIPEAEAEVMMLFGDEGRGGSKAQGHGGPIGLKKAKEHLSSQRPQNRPALTPGH